MQYIVMISTMYFKLEIYKCETLVKKGLACIEMVLGVKEITVAMYQ